MKMLRVKVDRVEDGYAVCYLPDGGMTDILLPDQLSDKVKDGAVITVQYDGDSVVTVMAEKTDDTESAERRARLDSLFKNE